MTPDNDVSVSVKHSVQYVIKMTLGDDGEDVLSR
jgi:hypothetical protein